MTDWSYDHSTGLVKTGRFDQAGEPVCFMAGGPTQETERRARLICSVHLMREALREFLEPYAAMADVELLQSSSLSVQKIATIVKARAALAAGKAT